MEFDYKKEEHKIPKNMLADIGEFQFAMITAIEKKQRIYKDQWIYDNEETAILKLYRKYNEFDLYRNPDKLISLANLAMLLYIKYKNYPETLGRKENDKTIREDKN